MKLLLHACCCPCTLEPLRLLLEEGHDIAIAYMNSNIHPAEEYEHRRAVLLDFAREQGLEVIEGVYDPQAWSRAAGRVRAPIPTSVPIAAARAIAFAWKRRARMPRPMVSKVWPLRSR